MANYKQEKAEKKPDKDPNRFVPDWERIYRGDPHTLDNLSEDDAKRAKEPCPVSVRAVGQYAISPPERTGWSIFAWHDPEGKYIGDFWMHRTALARSHMPQFRTQFSQREARRVFKGDTSQSYQPYNEACET